MAENDRLSLNKLVKDDLAAVNTPSGKTIRVHAAIAEGIKDEGGPRKGDFSCALDTVEAFRAAGLPVSMVAEALWGKGKVNFIGGEISLNDPKLMEETRKSNDQFAAFNTVDPSLIPNDHLLTGNSQALVELSRALSKSDLPSTGKVVSAILVIKEVKPAPIQTLPEIEPEKPSNTIDLSGKWFVMSEKKAA